MFTWFHPIGPEDTTAYLHAAAVDMVNNDILQNVHESIV
jgi:hypothetical protein